MGGCSRSNKKYPIWRENLQETTKLKCLLVSSMMHADGGVGMGRIWLNKKANLLMAVFLLFSIGTIIFKVKAKETIRIKIHVEQTYGELWEVSIPYYQDAKKILEGYGLQVVQEDMEHETTIDILAEGKPKTAKYTGGIQYTGAVVEGEIRVNNASRLCFQRVFKGEVRPAERLIKKCKTPQEAPFETAYKDSGFFLTVHAAAYVLGIRTAQEHIVNELNDRSPALRVAAADIIGELKIERGVKPLLGLLNDKNPKVRMSAVKALGLLGDRLAIEPLIKALKDKDKDVQKSAANALGDLGDASAVEPLIQVLRENLYVQSSAVVALGKIGTPSVEPLMSLFKEEALEALVRERIVETMGKIRDQRSVEALIILLHNDDVWLKQKAEDALVDLGDLGVPSLSGILFNGTSDVENQLIIIDILGRTKSPLAEKTLEKALLFQNSVLRKSAAKALGEFNTPTAMATLQNVAEIDTDWDVRNAAISSMEKMVMTIE